MKYVKTGLLISVFLALACGPSVAVKVIGAEDSPSPSGTGSAGGNVIASGSTWDAPPQKFEPRPIPFKQRGQVMRADISAMPPLTLRLGECYGIYDNDDNVVIAGGMGGASIGSSPSASPQQLKSGVRSSSSHRPSAPKSSAPKKRRVANSNDSWAGGGASSGAKMKEASASPTAERKAPASKPLPAPSLDMAAEEAPAEAPMADMAEGEEMAYTEQSEPPVDAYNDWGAAIYLSNDDSMSLSSAQRVMYAIDNFLPLPAEHIRPHELLNYFTFDAAEVADGHDFSVYPDIMADDQQEDGYTLGLSIAGRNVDMEKRRNVALTWVIDRSGSMQSDNRMEYLKRGLRLSLKQLKRGDMIHMVLFDHNVCTPVENFVVGRDNIRDLERAIDALTPQGSTDIHSGLREAYAIADRSYQGHHSNRVVLVTDALTNTGVTDSDLISMISKYYDSRRIRLSGVGVGREFNDDLLDKLTEKGKGAYVFLGSEDEVDAVFGPGFVSLIETVALDVHFRLHLPKSLRMDVFYGEESSVYKEDVQAIHYFANTNQLFLSDVVSREGALRPQDDIMLTIEYQDPESGDDLVEEYAFNLGDVLKNDPYNTRKGKFIIAWIDMLSVMASRSLPSQYSYASGAWQDDEGYAMCLDGTEQLQQLSTDIADDPEVRRVLQLWEKYCMRYTKPVVSDTPTLQKRTPRWPGAQPEETR